MNDRLERLREKDELILNFIGLEYPYNRPKSQWEKKRDVTKILTYPDPHTPYVSKNVKAKMLTEKDSETLVCTGDIADYYSKSRFPKSRHQDFKQELRALFFELEWLSTHWENVKIMMGNHDDRPEKLLNNLLNGHAELHLMLEPNLLKWLSSFFDNIEIVGTQVNLLGIDEMVKKTVSHVYQHGDIIFTHAERSNVKRETLMENISKWVGGWAGYLGLKPYGVIVQSHNHTDLKTTGERGEKWFLIPTASTPLSVGMEYVLHPKMVGRTPSVGYAVFYQDNGKTDYNRSGSILL